MNSYRVCISLCSLAFSSHFFLSPLFCSFLFCFSFIFVRHYCLFFSFPFSFLSDEIALTLTPPQEAHVQRAFTLLNANGMGNLSLSEVRQLLRVVDVPCDSLEEEYDIIKNFLSILTAASPFQVSSSSSAASTSAFPSLSSAPPPLSLGPSPPPPSVSPSPYGLSHTRTSSGLLVETDDRMLIRKHLATASMSYTVFRDALLAMKYFKMQSKRYWIAVDLEEAETLRAFVHSNQAQSILWQSKTAVGLRCVQGSFLLDATRGYITAPPMQQMTAEQCFRYLNSDVNFTDTELGILLRAIQDNEPNRRHGWYREVHACRRRTQRDLTKIPLGNIIFSDKIPDWYALIDRRALLAGIRSRIRAKGLQLLDAFRAFDYNRDGSLSCSELYGGLDWLGLTTLTPEDIYAIVRTVDKTGQGMISWEHFQGMKLCICFRCCS